MDEKLGDGKLSARERGLTLLLAMGLSWALTWLGSRVGACLGSVSYPALAHSLAVALTDPATTQWLPRSQTMTVDTTQGYLVIFLWCTIPAVLLGVRLAIQVKCADRGRTGFTDALRALANGYAFGICFTLLTTAIYYGYLLPNLPGTNEEFAVAPSVGGVLSDWQALSNGLLGLALWYLLPGAFTALAARNPEAVDLPREESVPRSLAIVALVAVLTAILGWWSSTPPHPDRVAISSPLATPSPLATLSPTPPATVSPTPTPPSAVSPSSLEPFPDGLADYEQGFGFVGLRSRGEQGLLGVRLSDGKQLWSLAPGGEPAGKFEGQLVTCTLQNLHDKAGLTMVVALVSMDSGQVTARSKPISLPKSTSPSSNTSSLRCTAGEAQGKLDIQWELQYSFYGGMVPPPDVCNSHSGRVRLDSGLKVQSRSPVPQNPVKARKGPGLPDPDEAPRMPDPEKAVHHEDMTYALHTPRDLGRVIPRLTATRDRVAVWVLDLPPIQNNPPPPRSHVQDSLRKPGI